ncbi:uncharacterized protein LOC121366824, partial [Gigantopelta aegis]|uniref:uncharacterized protein LOC121366824 n=1 Tax=Gigantopelta aegis TaxID=1735272 RepID=UPI001B88CB98
MSSYYGNILPGSGSTAAMEPALYNTDTKLDNMYLSNTQQMTYENCGSLYSSNSYMRYPGYDRMDARSVGADVKPPQYANASSSPTSQHQYPMYHHNGVVDSYGNTYDRLTDSKSSESCSPNQVPSLYYHQQQLAGMPDVNGVSPQNGYSPVNGMSPQNMPVYPWMRPANGGEFIQSSKIKLILKIYLKIIYKMNFKQIIITKEEAITE